LGSFGRVGREKAKPLWGGLAWARLSSLGRVSLEGFWLRLVWVNVGVQFSLFYFVYSPLALSSSFSPIIMKLTQM